MSENRPSLIDTHVHFDDPRFDADRHAVYRRAADNGVNTLVVPAVTRQRWCKLIETAAAFTGVHIALGLHPVFVEQHSASDLQLLEALLDQQDAVAVGECGLDGSMGGHTMAAQVFYFEAQLALARQYDLPVIVHARGAVEQVILTLRKHRGGSGVIHSYNGSEQQARQLIDLGYRLSFGGPITFPRARKLQALVKQLPHDAILFETDAPDQPPTLHRGDRNEPAYLTEVIEVAAMLRQSTTQHIAELSNRNAMALFGLDKHAQA